MDLVITYDIDTTTRVGERRLTAVAKVCEHYAIRVQKSVFEARLGEAQMQRMIGELTDLIEEVSDTIVIYRIPGELADSRLTFGREVGHQLGRPWIL